MARKRRSFSAEFKAEAVRLCKVGDRSVRQVAKELDLTETALREWVRRAKIDAGQDNTGALTTAEREEPGRLRRENQRPQMEREILDTLAIAVVGLVRGQLYELGNAGAGAYGHGGCAITLTPIVVDHGQIELQYRSPTGNSPPAPRRVMRPGRATIPREALELPTAYAAD